MTTDTPSQTADFLVVMRERGFLHQCTDEAALASSLVRGPVTAYAGFDATAESLHVGHLVTLMAMRWLMRTGNRAIVLLGGATTKVGDPSFRNDSRPMLGSEDVDRNVAGVRACAERALAGAGEAVFVDNADWLGGIGFIDFMRDVGSHFTVSRMLALDSVKSRLGDGGSLSMLEFSYMLLQAADFLELSRREGCTLQLGGSDQWGNICNGIELARRADGRELLGLTVPLLTTANGTKMGKTAAGAVWIDPTKLDAFGFRQFWRNVDDADTGRFLALFTELPMDEVRRLGALRGAEANLAKDVLADAVTALVHGQGAAADAARAARALFGGWDGPVTHEVSAPDGIRVADLVAMLGFASSKGEARRLIAGGAVRVGGERVADVAASVGPGEVRLAVGKRQAAVVALA